MGQPIGDETIDCDRVMHLLYKNSRMLIFINKLLQDLISLIKTFDMIDVDVKGYLPYVFGASKVFS